VVGLFEDLIGALPQLVKALAIAVIGWLIAKTMRGVVSNLVAASGLDKAGADFGLNPDKGNQRLSWIAGTLVYVVVLIPRPPLPSMPWRSRRFQARPPPCWPRCW